MSSFRPPLVMFRPPLLRTLAGLSCAVIPLAIAVHLFAEGFALGGTADAPSFLLRHLYLGAPLFGALWAFRRTIGLGFGRGETVRRCALLRADVRRAGAIASIAGFALVNLSFFVATEVLEGDPIAGGSLGIGVACAMFGAVLSALVVFICGRSLVPAVLQLAASARIERASRAGNGRTPFVAARSARSIFTLLAPSRPPPRPSFF